MYVQMYPMMFLKDGVHLNSGRAHKVGDAHYFRIFVGTLITL